MTHASVFSGIGGPEIAAAMLGWDNLFHCEINPFGRKVLDYWFPKSKSYEDITKTDFSEWRGKVDVLTGGFPCQPFSYAGQRRGAEDDRYLWPYMFRCIDQIRPDWVVAENVAGITTMVEQGEVSEMGGQASLFEEVDGLHRYQLRETFTLQRICDDLESHGYSVQPVLVPACAVGAPHRRDRVFIIGHLTDTNCTRQSASDKPNGRTRQTMDGERRCQSFDGTERPCTLRYATHPAEQCSKWLRPEQSETRGATQEQSGGKSGEDGSGPTSTDTSDIGAGKLEQAECEKCGRPSLSEFRKRHGTGISEDEGVCGEHWLTFPSVSPVHRGNDGLPFDVDRLTLSFGKWRTESLKAYGNAIVPQVMYEIFRAIELAEKKRTKTNKRVEAATK